MKRICFIVVYFGAFKNYFPLFLKSCTYNSDLCDWLIITDNSESYEYPENVKKVSVSWDDLKAYIQSKFSFPIALERPYKLCDFKPAYGYLFEDYIQGYEFWGHCDIDLIWGKIGNFLTDDILSGYDKIFDLGHCTIYRNNQRNNCRFMESLDGTSRYREVFSSADSHSFDEEYNNSIDNIFIRLGQPIYTECYAANLYTKTSDFRLTYREERKARYTIEPRMKNFFIWKSGQLLRFFLRDGKLQKKEYMYIHFQARLMKMKLSYMDTDIYKIIPNTIEDLELPLNEVNIRNLKKIKTKYWNLHYFRLRTKNLFDKIKKRLRKKK